VLAERGRGTEGGREGGREGERADKLLCSEAGAHSLDEDKRIVVDLAAAT
jgi:hypothetical protein